jgi:hypothetical protein
MTKTQVEAITSVQRRRRWSRAEKERIVAAAMQSGPVASEGRDPGNIRANCSMAATGLIARYLLLHRSASALGKRQS